MLSRVRSESVSVWCMWSPRSADRRSVVWEYHDGWWALKSPRMIVSPWAWEKSWREGVKCGGHDEIGGMYMLYMCMGMLFMVAVMAKCSVVWSVWKRWLEGRGVQGMEWWTRVMRPPPPEGPERSRRMVA